MTDCYDRPELTTTIRADPRLDGLPQGEFRSSLHDGRLHIDHADPRVVTSVQLLEMIHEGNARDGVTLTLSGDESRCCLYAGSVLRIEAVNRTVVYRITECLHWYLGYIAEWPD